MKGENENPHSEAEMRGKFVRLTKDMWGEAHANRVLEAVLKLHEAPDFAKFADEHRI